ncbi:hypothetical protein BH10PLA1_BH10PLA1_04110 [soil metagenome]
MGGCASHRTDSSPTSHVVALTIEIQAWALTAGWANYINIAGDTLTIVRHDDFGSAPKELWRKRLDEGQVKNLNQILASIPVDRLKEEYLDPHIVDGWLARFKLSTSDGQTKVIAVWNIRQPDLAKLVDATNAIVPKEHQIYFESFEY